MQQQTATLVSCEAAALQHASICGTAWLDVEEEEEEEEDEEADAWLLLWQSRHEKTRSEREGHL